MKLISIEFFARKSDFIYYLSDLLFIISMFYYPVDNPVDYPVDNVDST